jgi:hypothetical protein
MIHNYKYGILPETGENMQSNNLKIKMVKFYQSVRFNKKEYTSATNPDFITMRTSDEKLKISVNSVGVTLENDEEVTQISWNNVAYINYVKEDNVESKQEQLPEPVQKPASKKQNFRDI